MGIGEAIVISVSVAVLVGGFWTFLGHYLGSRELRKGFQRMDERFGKMDERFERMDKHFQRMDERFEALLKESSEAHTRMLEAIREIARRRK